MNYKQKILHSQKDLRIIEKTSETIIVKAKFGPSVPTILPLKLNEDIAFFVGAILGDGHLRKNKLQIGVELQNKNLIDKLIEICNRNFNRNFNVNHRYKGGKKYYHFFIDSKSIYNLLNQVYKIPSGRKSSIIEVPYWIKRSSKDIKKAFLCGVMATGGGKRKRGYGLSTASVIFWKDLCLIFEEVGIMAKRDKWIHKKYKKQYYGLSFKDKEYSIIQAGVPEWSNGLDLGEFP